jgi:hypothetical protein
VELDSLAGALGPDPTELYELGETVKELVYLLRVPEHPALLTQIARALSLSEAPNWVMVSTLAPLSNFGYLEGHEASILSWTAEGIGMGLPESTLVPRSFIPWQNIAYIAEGDLLKDYNDFRALPGNSEATLVDFHRQNP